VWRWDGSRYRAGDTVREPALTTDVAVDLSGDTIAMADIDSRIVVRSLSDDARRRVLHAAGSGPHPRLAFSSDGSLIVQADQSLHGIALWDAATGLLLGIWREPGPPESAEGNDPLIDSGPGAKAFAVTTDKSLVLWRLDIEGTVTSLCAIAGELGGNDRTRYLQGTELPTLWAR